MILFVPGFFLQMFFCHLVKSLLDLFSNLDLYLLNSSQFLSSVIIHVYKRN